MARKSAVIAADHVTELPRSIAQKKKFFYIYAKCKVKLNKKPTVLAKCKTYPK